MILAIVIGALLATGALRALGLSWAHAAGGIMVMAAAIFLLLIAFDLFVRSAL